MPDFNTSDVFQKPVSPQPAAPAFDIHDAPVVPVSEWLIMRILLAIPVVNLILLFIWAGDSYGNPNRTNFAKAELILLGIKLVILALFLGLFMGVVMRFAQNFYYM